MGCAQIASDTLKKAILGMAGKTSKQIFNLGKLNPFQYRSIRSREVWSLKVS